MAREEGKKKGEDGKLNPSLLNLACAIDNTD